MRPTPRPPEPLPSTPVITAVEDTMYRALAVLRLVLLGNSVVLYAVRAPGYARPTVGWAIIIGLVVWTFYALWRYTSAPSRRRWLLGVDLVLAVSTIAVTELVKGPDFRATLPGFWVAGVVLAWAVRWRTAGGLVAALAVCIADIGIRDEFTQTNYGNLFLLVIGGPIVGFLAGLLQRMAAERDEALRVSAVAAERQRLARVVHDGVLQVLAIVQRRGAEIGGETAELGRLAGEQEAALRAFVQHDPAAPQPSGQVDLGHELATLASANVQISGPAGRVSMDAARVEELVAVVSACLSNVRHHVGHDAPAWVLLEDLGDRVAISVRDNGPGIPEGRLEEAAAQGRLGVASSIRGRIEELGGTARLHSSTSGTEWEFEVPR